jgi:hypothetical protein
MTMMACSSPVMMTHRSSPSRSFLLAPTALRGLHLEQLPRGGPNRQLRGKTEDRTEHDLHHVSTRISYTKFLSAPSAQRGVTAMMT